MSPSQIITIKEIRVLSGLSRGAAIPLESALYIGSDPACDLFLMDPGIKARHLLVEQDAAGNVIVVDLTDPTAGPVEKAQSTRFFVGDVELAWCDSDTPWQTGGIDSSAQALPPPNERPNVVIPVHRYSRRRRTWINLAGCVSILCAFISFTIYRSHTAPVTSLTRKTSGVNQLLPAQLLNLRAKVQERLTSKSFPQLSVSATDGMLLITGNIRGDQPKELEILIQSIRRENPLVRISLKLTEPSPLTLPFKIVAMVGGPAPNILLSTNQFLSMGSESDGYRLVLVNGACLTFEHIETRQRLKECLDSSSPNR